MVSLIEICRGADQLARARFTYRPDGPRDRWRSFHVEARAGEAWSGDCDDLGATALTLAVEIGADQDRLYRARVLMPGGTEPFDHYVALLEDDGVYVFGDTERGGVYPLSRSGYRVHSAARVSAGLAGWRLWGER